MKSFRFEEPPSRRRGDEVGESNEVATKIMFFKYNRATLLSSFHFIRSKYKWVVGTYHVYKKVYAKRKARFTLSFLTDKLRKYYDSNTKIYITREYSEDRTPHYHFLIGLPYDEWHCTQDVYRARNYTLWYREWATNDLELVSFIDTHKGQCNIPLFKYYGHKQRWFKYGIWQYLLYIFKYSNYRKYEDFFIQV